MSGSPVFRHSLPNLCDPLAIFPLGSQPANYQERAQTGFPTGALSGVRRGAVPPCRCFLDHTSSCSGSKRRALNMEVFSKVVENPIPAPVKLLDSILVHCQIFSSDKDLNDTFFLHSLGSGRENPIFFTLLWACPTKPLPY